MKYMGGKSRHAKEILQVIFNRIPNATTWVEPFVGGAHVLDRVPSTMRRFANDINSDLIALYRDVQSGKYVPPDEVTEEEYRAAKEPTTDPAHRAFVGIGCSYGGKWFGGYARNYPRGTLESQTNRRSFSTAGESKRSLMKQNFNGVVFSSGSYADMAIQPNSVIYCDPPYAGTTGYKTPFDHAVFWGWCEDRSKEGHSVFVSEYNAPTGWACIWEKTTGAALEKNRVGVFSTERLFVHAQ